MLEVFSYVATFLAGMGAGVVVKVRLDASRRSTSGMQGAKNSQGTVEQRENTVGGHMAGRDVTFRGVEKDTNQPDR